MSERVSKSVGKLLDAIRWFIVMPVGLMLLGSAMKQTLITVLLFQAVLSGFLK